MISNMALNQIILVFINNIPFDVLSFFFERNFRFFVNIRSDNIG